MPLHPLTTQIVGSYAKPHWLARHQRMRALDGSWWRPDAEVLQEAKEDAARLAIYEQEHAGLDLVTDGEAQRAAYDRDFLAGLTGIDTAHTETIEMPPEDAAHPRDETGWEEFADVSRQLPRVTGRISLARSVARDEVAFAKAVARKPLKTTLVGPVTLARQVADHFYRDSEALVLDIAAALNDEMRAVEAAGADVIQIDEPAWQFRLDLAREVGPRAIARMVRDVSAPVIVHVCYGYAIVYKEKTASQHYAEALDLLADCPITGISIEYEQPGHQPDILRRCGDKHVLIGLLDLGNEAVETPDHIADRLRAALEVVPPERLHPCSDCGMWYLPRERAYGKIAALATGAAMVRRELGIDRG